MRRGLAGVAAALLLSGCASAGGEGARPAPVAVAAAPAGGADVAVASEAGDEDFRYVPPLPTVAMMVKSRLKLAQVAYNLRTGASYF